MSLKPKVLATSSKDLGSLNCNEYFGNIPSLVGVKKK